MTANTNGRRQWWWAAGKQSRGRTGGVCVVGLVRRTQRRQEIFWGFWICLEAAGDPQLIDNYDGDFDGNGKKELTFSDF